MLGKFVLKDLFCLLHCCPEVLHGQFEDNSCAFILYKT